MKRLFLLSAMLFSALTQANEIKIYDRTSNWATASMLTAKFEVQPETGRAYLAIIKNRGSEISGENFERRSLKGLSYDSSNGEINLEHEGRLINCANLVEQGRWVFRRQVVIETGRCRFEKREVTVSKNLDFESFSENRISIFLVID